MAKLAANEMKRLWELTQEGKSPQEIMRELNLADIAMVNNALEELIHEKGLNTGGTGIIGDASLNARYTEEGIRIAPGMLSGKGFMPGDNFRFSVEGNRIILEKTTREE